MKVPWKRVNIALLFGGWENTAKSQTLDLWLNRVFFVLLFFYQFDFLRFLNNPTEVKASTWIEFKTRKRKRTHHLLWPVKIQRNPLKLFYFQIAISFSNILINLHTEVYEGLTETQSQNKITERKSKEKKRK